MVNFNQDLIMEVKKRYSPSTKYNCYEVVNQIATILSNHGKKVMELLGADLIPELHITNSEYHVVAEDFELLRLKILSEVEGWTYINFLFCEDIEQIYEKYLKQTPIPKMVFHLSKGAYVPKRDIFGWHLEPVPVGTSPEPILNHDMTNMLLKEITAFSKKEHIYKELGVDYKRGIMLYGEAGNGKTTFIKHLLHKLDGALCILFNARNNNLVEFMEFLMEQPNAAKFLKVIVLEDIDGMDSSNRSNFLNFLDGLRPIHNTIFISTTNFPDKVDVALKNRPSRFDSIYYIGVPNSGSRKKLLQMYFKNLTGKELDDCIVSSKGFSGAYFKEFYLFSKLNDYTPLEAINEIKRRRELIGATQDNDCDCDEEVEVV